MQVLFYGPALHNWIDDPMNKSRSDTDRDERGERLAQALRDNLRKRKAQDRARRDIPGTDQQKSQVPDEGRAED